MATRAVTSRVSPAKGKPLILYLDDWPADFSFFRRFGWVNASYQYGLTIVNTHMKRALGTCTPWETFRKATERDNEA